MPRGIWWRGVPLIHAEHMLQHMLRKCSRHAKHMLESICSSICSGSAQDMLEYIEFNIYYIYIKHILEVVS